ncbi:MAG: hypothetical protein R6U40_12920 [Desulfobacterales bacterium]
MTNSLISALVMLVIGLALLPVVNSFVETLTRDADIGEGIDAGVFNGTPTGSLIDLLPVLYVIIIVVGFVSYLKIKQ